MRCICCGRKVQGLFRYRCNVQIVEIVQTVEVAKNKKIILCY
jgi:hypothetical protein